MSRALREALQYARNVLWELLVANEKGEIKLDENWKGEIDQCERFASSALENEEASEEKENE